MLSKVLFIIPTFLAPRPQPFPGSSQPSRVLWVLGHSGWAEVLLREGCSVTFVGTLIALCVSPVSL